MFKDRSKIFFFTIVVECILSFTFLMSIALRGIVSYEVQEILTVGTLYSLMGLTTTGVLLVIGTIINVVSFIYKKVDLMTIGTTLIIATLVTDFFGSTLLLCFHQNCTETNLCGSILYLTQIILIVVILMIAFDDQMKLLKAKKSK